MTFGSVYNLEYKKEIKRAKKKNKQDPSPEIICIQVTEQKIIGINLNYVSKDERNDIKQLYNQQIFLRFSYDNNLLMKALNSQEQINNQKLAELYMTRNASNNGIMQNAAIKLKKIKSSKRLYEILTNAFRIYAIKDLDEKWWKDVQNG